MCGSGAISTLPPSVLRVTPARNRNLWIVCTTFARFMISRNRMCGSGAGAPCPPPRAPPPSHCLRNYRLLTSSFVFQPIMQFGRLDAFTPLATTRLVWTPVSCCQQTHKLIVSEVHLLNLTLSVDLLGPVPHVDKVPASYYLSRFVAIFGVANKCRKSSFQKPCCLSVSLCLCLSVSLSLCLCVCLSHPISHYGCKVKYQRACSTMAGKCRLTK